MRRSKAQLNAISRSYTEKANNEALKDLCLIYGNRDNVDKAIKKLNLKGSYVQVLNSVKRRIEKGRVY